MSLKNSLIVLWVYIMYVLGIWIFLSGFLLKRIVVHQNSTLPITFSADIICQNLTSLQSVSHNFYENLNLNSQNKNSLIQRFDKAVIIIIDALRYDFVFPNASLSEHGEYYVNKMPIFKRMMGKYPNQTMLLRLQADPPTTTLQRLKGITTGSLPTFIDVGSNFASREITEDSIIRQMKANGKRIIFMGDDTWESVFPNYFLRSFPFPSFNTKDLDTVDDGILEHIYLEMDKEDSDITIAHFLGVDHCGHRYGPRHPEMSRKLSQMNIMIQKVIQKLRKDSILIVLGDHGMTENGDHGGDSFLEVSTALFIYSPTRLTWNFVMENQLSASQIDVVPTLSLLLGLPIPFSNLGAAIPQVFTLKSKNVCFDDELDHLIGAALALAENSQQVNQYLKTYSAISNELPGSVVNDATEQLKRVTLLWNNITNNATQAKDILMAICSKYKDYLFYIKKECEKIWATFSLETMIFGFVILCAAVFINLFSVENTSYEIFSKHAIVGIVTCFLFVLFYTTALLISICTTLVLFIFFQKHFHSFFIDVIQLLLKAMNFPSIIIAIFFLASFSNSFVIHEDSIVMYLLQSTILYRFFPSLVHFAKQIVYKDSNITGKDKSTKHHSKNIYKQLLLPILLMCLMACIRMGPLFRKCREEQFPCEDSYFLTSLENIDKSSSSSSSQVMHLGLSWISIAIPSILFVVLMIFRTSQKSYTVAMICVKYGISFVCVCTCLRWWLNIVPADVIERILKGNEVLLTRTALITSIIMCLVTVAFPVLSERPWEMPSKEVYSGSLGLFAFTILQPLYLTAGDGMASAMMLMSFCIVLHVILIEISIDVSESHAWIDMVTWSLLSRHWFYSTGHQPAFPTIQWDAAFLINHKEASNYIISGVLVLMNTFSSFILHGVTLPILLIWSKSTMYTSRGVLRIQLSYILFSGVKLIGTVGACIILRRHLMVWAIFAPKLIYEVCGMIITMLTLIISYCFMCRVTSCYHRLIKTNFSHIFTSKDQ